MIQITGQRVDQGMAEFDTTLQSTSNWTWPNTDDIARVGVTTWSVNSGRSMQMNKARARLSQLAKQAGKPNRSVCFVTVGGEETLSLAMPYSSNPDRGEVQSFADSAARLIVEREAEALAQQFNEGFWRKEFTMLAYREGLSFAQQ